MIGQRGLSLADGRLVVHLGASEEYELRHPRTLDQIGKVVLVELLDKPLEGSRQHDASRQDQLVGELATPSTPEKLGLAKAQTADDVCTDLNLWVDPEHPQPA